MAGKSYFLCKVDTIDGESPDPQYPGFFEVESWGFNVSMHSTGQTGRGMVAGKCDLGEFRCSKYMDKASPKLFEACAKGVAIGSVKVVGRKQGRSSGELEEFANWIFTNVVITTVQPAGSDGGGIPMEEVGFAYEKIEFKYDVKKADGSSEGWQGGSFDSKTNQAA